MPHVDPRGCRCRRVTCRELILLWSWSSGNTNSLSRFYRDTLMRMVSYYMLNYNDNVLFLSLAFPCMFCHHLRTLLPFLFLYFFHFSCQGGFYSHLRQS